MKNITSILLAFFISLSLLILPVDALINNNGEWLPAESEWEALNNDGVVARFAVGADLHFPDNNSTGKLHCLYNTLSRIGNVDGLFIAGDVTSEGNRREYEELMQIVNGYTFKNEVNPNGTGNAVGATVLSLGNNDLSVGTTEDFSDCTGQEADSLYFLNGIPVITLSPDEYIPERGGAELEIGNNYDLSAEFLKNAYGEIDSAGYTGLIIMIAHHRPGDDGTECVSWSQEMLDMIKAHPNTVIFTGHSHTWIWPTDEFILQDAGFTHVRAGSLGPEGGLDSAEIYSSFGSVNDPAAIDGDFNSTFTLVDIMEDGTARLRRVDNAKGEFMHGGEYLTVRPNVLTDYIANTENENFSKSYGGDAKAPRFPDDGTVTAEDLGNGTSVVLHFPEAIPYTKLSRDAVTEYRIRLKNLNSGDYVRFGEKDHVRVGNYRLAEDEGKPWSVTVHGLDSNAEYLAEVRAYGSYGITTDVIYSVTDFSVSPTEPEYDTRAIIDFDSSYGSVKDGAGHVLVNSPSLYKNGVTSCSQGSVLFTGFGENRAFLYEFSRSDYEAVRYGFTMESYFSAGDVENRQVLMGDRNGAFIGMRIESGEIHLWARFVMTPEDTQSQTYVSYPIEKNEWTHVIAVYNGYTVKLYVNGKAVRASSENTRGGLAPISYTDVDENGKPSGEKKTYYAVGSGGYDGGEYLYPVSGGTEINKAALYSGAMTEEDVKTAYKIATTALPFTDVKDGWYIDSVEYAYNTGLMKGSSETTFSPSVQTNRAMIVQMLYNLEGAPEVDTNDNPFTDVSAGKWYTKAVLWAYQNGVTTGTSKTTFSPDTLVTREQVAVFLYRYLKDYKKADVGEGADLSAYPDSDSISKYAGFKDAVAWANANGIIGGKKNGEVITLAPLDKAMRSEVAKMFVSFAKKY